MIVGVDYWNVISHWPYFAQLSRALLKDGHEVHVVSAVGRQKAGSVEPELDAMDFPRTSVTELLFAHPRESPELKLAACKNWG